jgi:hypothetical protein
MAPFETTNPTKPFPNPQPNPTTMNHPIKTRFAHAACCAALLICGNASAQGRNNGGVIITPVTAIVSVAITGLLPSETVVLQNNGDATDNMTFTGVSNSASKSFKPVVSANYSVKIITQLAPSSLRQCTIARPTGLAAGNVTVAVVCGDARFQAVTNPSGGTYPATECVKDMVTGRVWEGKTAGGMRAGSNGYTYFDDVTQNQKQTGQNRKPTLAEINANTNAIGYRDAVNASNLCGFSDWKIPTMAQLIPFGAALDDPQQGPARKQTWFPNFPPFVGYFSMAQPLMIATTHVDCYVTSGNNIFPCPRDGDKPQQNGAFLRLVR